MRLSCILLKGFVDCRQEVEKLLEFARSCGATQVTIVPVTEPQRAEDQDAHDFAEAHQVDDRVSDIRQWLDSEGSRLLVLGHGAIIYDYKGQNICLSNCLTETTDPTRMRN